MHLLRNCSQLNTKTLLIVSQNIYMYIYYIYMECSDSHLICLILDWLNISLLVIGRLSGSMSKQLAKHLYNTIGLILESRNKKWDEFMIIRASLATHPSPSGTHYWMANKFNLGCCLVKGRLSSRILLLTQNLHPLIKWFFNLFALALSLTIDSSNMKGIMSLV